MLRSASVKHAARRWLPLLALVLHAQVGAVKVEREAASPSSAAPAIEVWMTNEESASGQTVLLLYVKSTQTLKLHVSVSITKKGEAGTSLVRQQASLQALAGEATQLANLKLDLSAKDECHVTLVLDDLQALKEVGQYRFDCQP